MTETTKYTVELLQQERAKIRKQLEANKTAIVNHWASLVTPAPADTKVQMWVNQAEKAYAIYDGVMLGYKLFRKFNHFVGIFGKKSEKEKDKAKKPRVDLSKTSYPNLNQTNYIMFSIFKYTCKIHTTIILSKLLQERD